MGVLQCRRIEEPADDVGGLLGGSLKHVEVDVHDGLDGLLLREVRFVALVDVVCTEAALLRGLLAGDSNNVA